MACVAYLCDCCGIPHPTEAEAQACEERHSAVCPACGKSFYKRRGWQVYCRPRCKERAKEARHRSKRGEL